MKLLRLLQEDEYFPRSRDHFGPTIADHTPVPGAGLLRFSETLPTIKQAADLLVAEAMRRSGGNQSLAAGLLGISHQALSKRLKKQKLTGIHSDNLGCIHNLSCKTGRTRPRSP